MVSCAYLFSLGRTHLSWYNHDPDAALFRVHALYAVNHVR